MLPQPRTPTPTPTRGPGQLEFRTGQDDPAQGFDGQEQTYFLAEILGAAENEIRVDRKEFSAHQWIFPHAFKIEWVPPIKRETSRAVFRDFFDISLP